MIFYIRITVITVLDW